MWRAMVILLVWADNISCLVTENTPNIFQEDYSGYKFDLMCGIPSKRTKVLTIESCIGSMEHCLADTHVLSSMRRVSLILNTTKEWKTNLKSSCKPLKRRRNCYKVFNGIISSCMNPEEYYRYLTDNQATYYFFWHICKNERRNISEFISKEGWKCFEYKIKQIKDCINTAREAQNNKASTKELKALIEQCFVLLDSCSKDSLEDVMKHYSGNL